MYCMLPIIPLKTKRVLIRVRLFFLHSSNTKKYKKSYVLASVQMETKLLEKNILLIVAKIVRAERFSIDC